MFQFERQTRRRQGEAMNKDDLVKLLGNHEDNFVERKPEGVAPAELRQTVCAFANSVPEGRVGVLFIGIHDKTGGRQRRSIAEARA